MEKFTNILVGERLEKVIRYYKMSPNEFSKLLGFERADKIYNIIKGRFLPSFEILYAITNKLVDIDLVWIITGKGDMLKQRTDQPSIDKKETGYQSKYAIDMIRELSAENALLKAKLEKLHKEKKAKNINQPNPTPKSQLK